MPKKQDAKTIYKDFLDKAKKEYEHTAINQIVGKETKAVFTEAEVEAGLNFSKWLQEKIGERYEIIGGKTYNFTSSRGIVLIPKDLAESRLWLNKHAWKDGGYVTV